MTDFEVKNLIAIRRGIDRHNSDCPVEAEAIMLHPYDYALMGYERLWGIPVIEDDRVPVKTCRIQCSGSAHAIEEELSEYLAEGDD